jgi:hypothetical protein
MKSHMTGMLVLLAGCGGPAQMGQFGEEDEIRCEATSRTPVLPEDVVELGYVDSPQTVLVSEVLASAVGTFTETLEWADGTMTPVTAGIENAGSPEVVTYEDAGGAFENEAVLGACPTRLELTVDVILTTEDGRLDDAFVADVSATGEQLYVEHRITAPAGTIDVQALAQDGVDVEADVIRVDMALWADSTRFTGNLAPQPIGGFDDDAQALGWWPISEEEED